MDVHIYGVKVNSEAGNTWFYVNIWQYMGLCQHMDLRKHIKAKIARHSA